jgi:hypothetical protein
MERLVARLHLATAGSGVRTVTVPIGDSSDLPPCDERQSFVPSSPSPQILPPVDDEDRPPICPRCGVTMVPAALSADDEHEGEWVCLECEELGEDA